MGTASGVQRYLCHSCRRSFRGKRRPSKLRCILWREFVFNRSTINQLASKYNRSIHWIRKELRAYEPSLTVIAPRPIVAVIDGVFFGRTSGYLVVRDPMRKENVYWSKVTRETVDEYQFATDTLESLGFVIQAVVVDGKPGLKRLYEDIPLQMCQFHQRTIVRRYLTMRPRLEAGKELNLLMKNLTNCCRKCFTRELAQWHEKWREFLAERTINPETGKGTFTHKRLRSAYRSLKTNIPYLFTYLEYPELSIPNTTNGLEGSFSHLKGLVRVHRGLKPDLKRKMIEDILQNRHRNL